MLLLPLDAPGLLPPGPDFLAKASEDMEEGLPEEEANEALGLALSSLYSRALYMDDFRLPVGVGDVSPRLATFVPGHPWGLDDEALIQRTQDQRIGRSRYGPRRRHEVMVVGKHPAERELALMLNFAGKSGEELVKGLREAHVTGFHDFYVTNLVRFEPPTASSTLRANWIKNCMPLLQMEIGLIRPRVILLLGSDASKALIGKNVKQMIGRSVDYNYTALLSDGSTTSRTAKVVTLVHPAAVVRDESQKRSFVNGLSLFDRVRHGKPAYVVETDIDHRVATNLDELEECIAAHEPLIQRGLVAVDAEWLGSRPQNPNEKRHGLRTIQFSVGPKKAFCVELRDAEGNVCFLGRDGKPALNAAIARLLVFMKGKRVIGHYFNSDLEWLCDEGFDLRQQFAVPLFPDESGEPAWVRTRFEGGADTGAMAHAIEETAEFGLKVQALRYTDAPPYSIDLEEWLKEARKKAKDVGDDFEGFGDVPREKLIPYGNYDADVTMRLYLALEPLLDCDYQGNCCREAFWTTMIAAPGVLEMHQTGILLDDELAIDMTADFLKVKELQEAKIVELANWHSNPSKGTKADPDGLLHPFNVRSVDQVKEYLFTEKYNKKFDAEGRPMRLRPPEAKTLNLSPVLTTSKPVKAWADVEADGKTADFSPSTSKQALALMAEDCVAAGEHGKAEAVLDIKRFRNVDTILKSYLRPPDVDKKGVLVWDDELEEYVYSKGIMSFRCEDGRIRTHFNQTKETGRWSSSRPNLQNVGKNADSELAAIFARLGMEYNRSLRSIFRASPGHVLIDADFIGAELYGVAIMAGDPAMIDHCKRNQLPDDHPDFYDLHSHAAVEMFKLDCKPTKKALGDAGKGKLRNSAKTIEFGVNYGRGPKAIVVACKQEGVNITVAEAEAAIQAWFDRYPKLNPFFNECKFRANGPRWLSSCFGRLRRFPYTNDRQLAADFERQAMNFPIQAMIAEAMSRAIAYLMWLRDEYYCKPDLFRLLLQVHDSLVLEVPYKYAAFVNDVMLPFAMSKCVPIYRTDLEGKPTGEGPYYLGVSSDIYLRWGDDTKSAKAVVQKGMDAVRMKTPGEYWIDKLGSLPELAA